ncbi:hypothetical protein ACUNV4_18070 [Granulosicoccus sp. 3-233]|uniref:hypothetical protein n=1 Tax=Granulosicoccus sp. 3-233 TaxID=3417969 RepID=UPI003D351865
MNVSTSNDLTSTAMSLSHAQTAPPMPPGGGDGGPSSRVAPMEALGGTLPEDAKNALFAGTGQLADSGASVDEIQSFVDRQLATDDGDFSAGSQRTGQLVDMMA